MSNPWFRVWADMVNDPKWRTIAKRSGQKIGDVIAVYLHMLTNASNADERGRTIGWCDEDVANALDIETEQVTGIRDAMQGRVLDGDYLTGWEKRQPLREDGSAERAKAWREAKKAEENTKNEREKTQGNESERTRTQPNAEERPEKIRVDEIRVEDKNKRVEAKKAEPTQAATRLPADWVPSESDIEFCKTQRPELKPCDVADRFRDYWVSQPNVKGKKTDWNATWRNWVRNEKQQARASPVHRSKSDDRRAFIDALTGASNDQRPPPANIIDIN